MAGFINRTFIDSLLARTDIIDVVSTYISLKKSGHNFSACCPFHNEKTPSFTVNANKQFYYCFGCGAHGNAVNFLMDHAQLEFVEAIEELAARSGVEVVYDDNQNNHNKTAHYASLYTLMDSSTDFYQKILQNTPNAYHYFKQRGLSDTIIQEFRLGYAPNAWQTLNNYLHQHEKDEKNIRDTGLITYDDKGRTYDRFRHRVIFPICDNRGRVIAFGGRVLDESKPKYLNSPETALFHKGRILYAWHRVRKQKPLEYVIIVEGYMDVLALAEHGINNAVATQGTAITSDHLKTLFHHVQHLVFCFDGDKAGQQAARRALDTCIPLLADGMHIQFCFLATGDDPDSLVRREGRDGFLSYITEGKSLSDYLFYLLEYGLQRDRLEDRAEIIKRAKPFLQKMATTAYKNLFLQQLSEISRVDLKNLATLINGEAEQSQNITRTRSTVKLKKTPLRMVIGFLIHTPQLNRFITFEHKQKLLQHAGEAQSLLNDVLNLITQTPDITTGVLLGHWQHHAKGKWILKLNQLTQSFIHEHQLDDKQIQAEFIDALHRISETGQHTEQVLQTLHTSETDNTSRQRIKASIEAILATKKS